MVKQHSELKVYSLDYESVLLLSDLEIDPAHRKVYCGNQEVSLTTKEYTLLCLLVANEGYVLTYDQIYYVSHPLRKIIAYPHKQSHNCYIICQKENQWFLKIKKHILIL